MIHDKDILLRLLQQAYTDDSLPPEAKREYEKLVGRFDEEGTELTIPLNDLDEQKEKALKTLAETGYTTQVLRYHGPSEGHLLHVTLRAKKFLDEKRMQEKTHSPASDFPSPASLVPPSALERMALYLVRCAEKAPENQWQKGRDFSRILAGLQRHLMLFMQRNDQEDHLAAVATHALLLLHYEAEIKRGFLPPELNDLPDYSQIPGVHHNHDDGISY